jgi:hypothetical protein
MTTTLLKNEITKALQNINDKSFLEALYTIIHTRSETFEFELSTEDKQILDKRKASYKNGTAKTYTLGEVRKKVMKNISA